MIKKFQRCNEGRMTILRWRLKWWGWILTVENVVAQIGVIFKFLASGLQKDEIALHQGLSIGHAWLWTAQAVIGPEDFPDIPGVDLRCRDG